MLPCGMMGSPKADLRKQNFGNAWRDIVKKVEAIHLSSICESCQNNSICHSCAAMAMAETGRFDGIPTYMCEMAQEMKKIAIDKLKIYGE